MRATTTLLFRIDYVIVVALQYCKVKRAIYTVIARVVLDNE